MEEVETIEFLPQVAEWVAEWFPDLGGRSVAVTDGDITKANRPTLPFSLCALNREDATPATASSRSQNGNIEINEDFIVELWFPVQRFTLEGQTLEAGVEKPFWAYYPTTAIRNRMISKMYRAFSDSANKSLGSISYTSMDIAADPQAVVLTFRFLRNYIWCPLDDEEDEEVPFTLSFTACPSTC